MVADAIAIVVLQAVAIAIVERLRECTRPIIRIRRGVVVTGRRERTPFELAGTVVVRRIGVVIVRIGVCATGNFQFIAYSVAIGVVQAGTIAIVIISWVGACSIICLRFGIVVARHFIGASESDIRENQGLIQHLGILTVLCSVLQIHQEVDLSGRGQLGNQNLTVVIRECQWFRVRQHKPACTQGVVHLKCVPRFKCSSGHISSNRGQVQIAVFSPNGKPAVVHHIRIDHVGKRIDLTGKGSADCVLVKAGGRSNAHRVTVLRKDRCELVVRIAEIRINSECPHAHFRLVRGNQFVGESGVAGLGVFTCTIIQQRPWVVVVGCRVGATRTGNFHLWESQRQPRNLERVVVGITQLNVDQGIGQPIRCHLRQQDFSVHWNRLC